METKKRKVYKIAKPISEDDWLVKRDFDAVRESMKICSDKARHSKVLAYAATLRKDASNVTTKLIEEEGEDYVSG